MFRSVSLAAMLLALSAPASAQIFDSEPDPTEPHGEFDDIIVTGTALSRSADELIGNITALDREEIVEDLRSTLGDTLDSEPGVATTFFGQGASRPVLRGLGSERILVLTNGIGVIDVSAISPDHQVGADGIDAQKIEILRGPAALAYGGQAVGGVVNVIDGLIPERLSPEPTHVEGYAAYNTVNEGVEAAAHGDANFGDFATAATVSVRDLGDYESAGGEIDNSFTDTFTAAGGASYIGDRGFVGAAVRYQDADYGLITGTEEAPFLDLEQIRVDVRGGYDTGNDVLTRVNFNGSWADYEHTEFEEADEPGTEFETDGVEGRLEVLTAFGDLDGAVGVQYVDRDLAAFGEEAFISPTETTEISVFAYQAWQSDAGYGVEGGARIGDVDAENVLFDDADFTLISGSIGGYREVNDWFFGIQGSYTERAPIASELFSDGPHLATQQFEIGDPDLNEETAVNVEGVARYVQGGFTASVNLFVMGFDDFVFLEPQGGIEDDLPIFAYVQEDATFRGGEIALGYELPQPYFGANWSGELTADYVRATLDDVAGNDDVPFIPPLTIRAALAADFDRLIIDGDLTFAAEQNDVGVGNTTTDSYFDLGLGASFEAVEGIRLFAQGRNLFDENIRFATSVLRNVAPAPGRNLRFGVRADF